MLENLCAPALIYVCFSLTQIIIDIFKGLYNTSFFKFCVMLIFTLLLNILCEKGLGLISWTLVFVPFILMTTITAILLFAFGLDPRTGKIKHQSRRHHKRHHNDSDSDSDSDDEHHRRHHHKRHHKRHHKHHHKHHHKKETCEKMGCIAWNGDPDGNCDTITDPKTGKCSKRCYYSCDIGTGTCKYDSECKPHCPVNEKIPCSSKPSPGNTTSTESFIANMLKSTRMA